MACSEIFVLLDDVQFSKQSYINRVKIRGCQDGRWLTVPVSVRLGDAIREVAPAKLGWAQSHLDTLRGAYQSAAKFKEAWPSVEALYDDLPETSIAAINTKLVRRLAEALGIATKLVCSSTLESQDLKSDDRLVQIVTELAPRGTYLSGKGGINYQAPQKFSANGISLEISTFRHPSYDQGNQGFVAGLSILDAVFHVGWQKTAELLR